MLNAPEISVGQWCEIYERLISSLPLKQNTLQNRRNYIRHIRTPLADRPLADVEPMDIIHILKALEQAGTPYMRRRVRIEAIQMFNAAIIARKINYNPAAPISYWHTRPLRSRLTLENWQAVHAWASGRGMTWFALALEFALVTGQRRADLTLLKHSDVVDGHLRIRQQKTGRRIALPLALRLEVADLQLGQVIERLGQHGGPGPTLLRKPNGMPYCPGHLSNTFREGLLAAAPGRPWGKERRAPSLHEIRSLSERLYRQQGIDTMTLLGHARQSMTDDYNDDRGLEAWKVLRL